VPQNRERICPVVYRHDQRLPVIIGFRQGDPIKRLARDAVLSQKETQLGGMLLDVAQGVHLELEKAHWLPPPPGKSHLALRLLV
jgi:hypothetical protein